MVYYLKYRPQNLSDLVGQAVVAETLTKAVATSHLAHAYLFYGPRGVGKTSTARILAKMVNCTATDVPCNSCVSCQSITDGSNLDFIEIDAASNRGIDDIRDLRDKIKLSTSNLKKKVYIIDEVHMLTNEAFNALLKTLEEPPTHVLFILATTEIQKIPQTVLSRVQRLDFKAATIDDISTALKKVALAEKLELSDEAAMILAQKSEGSFRDGIKLLDQLASQNHKISQELVEQTLGLTKFDQTVELVKLVIAKNGQSALTLVNQEFAKGLDSKELLQDLVGLLRNLLLIKHQAVEIVKRSTSQANFDQLVKLADGAEVTDLVRIIKIFEEASEKRKFSSIPTLPIEMAVVEACLPVVALASTGPAISVGPVSAASSDPSSFTSSLRARSDETSAEPPTANTRLDVVINDNQTSPTGPTDDMNILQDKWNYVLETIHPYNFSLEALLRVVKIGSCQDAQLVLKVPYSFHQRILETPRNLEMVESVVSDILGKKIIVSCVLDQTELNVDDLANVEVAADDEVIRIAAEIFNS